MMMKLLVLAVVGLVALVLITWFQFSVGGLFQDVRGRLLCLSGRHDRSKTSATRRGETYSSRCRRCDRPLRRIGKTGRWKVVEADSAQAD